MTNGVVKVSANIRRNMFAVRKFFALQAVVWLELPGRYAPLTRPKLNATVMSFLHDLSQVSHHQQTEREFNPELACNETPVATPWDEVGEATDAETAAIISKDFLVYKDFITEEEENSLFDEVEPYLKRLKYEENHWDDAILGYRETERKSWTQRNKGIFERLRALAFPPETVHLPLVHVLDLKASGVIKPHVDSIKFCGTTVSGISLLSSAVMRLVSEKEKSRFADVVLPRRSLYVMRFRARYEYTHEVLGAESSKFRGVVIPRERRIAVICRNEPPLTDSEE